MLCAFLCFMRVHIVVLYYFAHGIACCLIFGREHIHVTQDDIRQLQACDSATSTAQVGHML